MNIEVYAIAWNEERLIDQFIDWYSFASKITILNNYSTDRTVEIAISKGCDVKVFGSNEQDNLIMNQTKEECWKDSKADWVIVCDIDEFLYHEDLLNVLQNTEATVIKCEAYNFASEYPENVYNVREGVRSELYDKCVCFRPDKITSMNWTTGCHTCSPEGDVSYLEGVVKLLHFNMLGRQELKDRHIAYLERTSESDKKHGYGIHYSAVSSEVDKIFDEVYNNRKKVW